MPWLQVTFTVARDRIPAIEAAMQNAGVLAVTLGDAGDEPQLEPPPGATPLWPEVDICGLFPDDADSRERVEALAAEMGASPRFERLEDRIWERAWLDDFEPTRFGRRLWVCPRDQTVTEASAVVVKLDPGLAFGTGHHPTTALCLSWLDAMELTGKIMVDYGCGSGILAIAALQLGAARAIAVDHDPQALEATDANARENRVAERLVVCAPEAMADTEADLLVANILAAPLIELAPRLAAFIRPGGWLGLSGILREQTEQVAAAYVDYLELEATTYQEDWALLVGRRKPLKP